MIFRIDDISVNTNQEKLMEMLKTISLCLAPKIILGVSVAVNEVDNERVFPKIFNAYSDHRNFFLVEKIGVPQLPKNTLIASHGLFHVDHRLLTKECQEMSILSSCSILKADYFIPPFNKYNSATEEICKEQSIELIRFEDGWKHLKYEKFTGEGMYYFHTHDFTLEEFQAKLK